MSALQTAINIAIEHGLYLGKPSKGASPMHFYSATFSNGERVTRATDRTYSHAWQVTKAARPKTEREVARWTRYGDASTDWAAQSWTGFGGREDLAHNAARAQASLGTVAEDKVTVEVLPVVEHTTRKAMKGGAA